MNRHPARAQAFQRLVNDKRAKRTNHDRADFFHIPAAGAEIAGGEIKPHGQNKDEKNGAYTLHQAAEEGHHACGELAFFISREISGDDKFAVAWPNGVKHTIKERARQ
ncbi:hypothetical protein D3C72_924760 [compost metagenome]